MISKIRNRHEQVMPVRIPIKESILYGDLRLVRDPLGIVMFVHGSGSSLFSPRNLNAAEELNKWGLSTLLLDLITDEELRIDAETMQSRFDIPLLVSRSTLAACWVRHQPELSLLPIGLFGASRCAAAALITAAVMKHEVAAVVSHGGRADLVEDALKLVAAPTLLIVGGEDETLVALNKQAAMRMHCINKLHVVPRATNLIGEPGALEQVVSVAAEWFVTHMQSHVLNQRAVC
jgi:putative phosphoribosyl transferase